MASWFFNEYSLHILESDPLLLTIYNETHPLKLGILPLTILFAAAAHIIFCMLTDLYGSKKWWAMPFMSAGAVICIWSFFAAIPSFPFLEGGITLSTVLHSVINFELEKTLNIALSLFIMHLTGIIGFQLSRKLWRGHLILPHLITASILATLGFGCILGKEIFLSQSEWAVLSITQAFQFLATSIFLIPVFYIIRIPFRLITGSQYAELKSNYRKKSLFKPDEDFMASHEKAHDKRLKAVDVEPPKLKAL
ncbi:hypothetical protein K1X76_00025 [bacterium]|nr:hypothetical protein [bacterium]